MTNVEIWYVNSFFRVKIKGHAGYGADKGLPEGHDIVCAAVSILGQTLTQYFMDLEQEGKAIIHQKEVEPGQIYLSALVKNQEAEAARQAVKVIMRGFDLLADCHPEHVRKGWGHDSEKCDMV